VFIDKFREVNHDFRSTMHQDAHEFFNFLLNRIVEEIEEERKTVGLGEPSRDDRELN
jgi:ubiquitin carboxyl-terminal hydrolase 9/13